MMWKWIEKMFKHSFEKEWYETYWAFDVHGTILVPTFRKNSFDSEFYPFADAALKLLSDRKDIKLILYTSSYPEEIEHYMKVFKEKGINFDYINENPEIDSSKGNFGYYEDKFYFNALFDDKAGFDPEEEWYEIWNLLYHYQKVGYLPDPNWSTKY